MQAVAECGGHVGDVVASSEVAAGVVRETRSPVALPEVGDGDVAGDRVKGSCWVTGTRVPTSSIPRTL